MFKSVSNEGCQCRNKSRQNFSNMQQVKFQNERSCDNKFKNAKTQTDPCLDEKAQEQIAELLTEIAVIISQKSDLENQVSTLQNQLTRSDDVFNKEKVQIDEEITRLAEANIEKDSLLCNLKISHLEEQKALLSQINELKTELHVAKEQKEQSQHNLSTSRAILEHKLNATVLDLKNEQDKNEVFQSKVNKYKIKIRYLTKYIKQLIDEVNAWRLRRDQGDHTDYKKSISFGCRPKCISHENIPSTQNFVKKFEPDIENMILSELFFKPNPLPNDVASLFFCSTDGSQQ